MIALFFITSIVAVVIQIITIYYSYKLTVFVKPLKYWTTAWTVFTISMALVALRRIIALLSFAVECPSDMLWHEIEGLLLLVINLCWLYFVVKLKDLYAKYLNSDLK